MGDEDLLDPPRDAAPGEGEGKDHEKPARHGIDIDQPTHATTDDRAGQGRHRLQPGACANQRGPPTTIAAYLAAENRAEPERREGKEREDQAWPYVKRPYSSGPRYRASTTIYAALRMRLKTRAERIALAFLMMELTLGIGL